MTMNPAVEARLREHVASIIDGSAVPSAERDELAEELLGHLAQRWCALIAEGIDDTAAADRAIAEFGAADDLAPHFRSAYHSRLWASTIGVLLPLEARSDRPTEVAWLTTLTGIAAVVAGVLAVATALTATPLRAIVAGGCLAGGCLVLWLAGLALLRGQRWGYRVALAVAVLMVIQGIAQLLSGPGLQLSLFGAAAALALLRAAGARPAIDAWLARSRPIPRPWGAAIALAVGLSVASGFGAAAIHDPTQIGPADVDARAWVTCGPGGAEWEQKDAWHTVTVTVLVHWDRLDLFPRGFVRGQETYGSAVTFELAGAGDAFASMGAPVIEILTPDAGPPWELETGSWGTTVPDEVWLADDVRGIDGGLIAAGRTIRVTAEQVAPADVAGAAGGWPARLDVRYYHLDRFVLRAVLACGEEGVLRER